MKAQLVFNSKLMYIHKTKKTMLPSARNLQSSAGEDLIPQMLAVIYYREPICRKILRALLLVRAHRLDNVIPYPIQTTNTSFINLQQGHLSRVNNQDYHHMDIDIQHTRTLPTSTAITLYTNVQETDYMADSNRDVSNSESTNAQLYVFNA